MSELYPVLSQKLTWLSERARVISQNLALADLPDETRQDLKPFLDYIKNPSSGIIKTSHPIKRDFETLHMVRNEMEHEGVSYLMRMYHKMVKTASARNG